MPPATPFGGDGVLVTAANGGEGGRGCKDREGGDPHSSPSSRSLIFSASGPNSPGVVTELLIQLLRIAVSTPEPAKHRHMAFVSFVDGHLSEPVPAPSGWVSPAVRFVLTATGQASGLLLLEPVLVC